MRLRTLLTAVTCGAALFGCSVLIDVDDECSDDSECATGLRCEQNLCVAATCNADEDCQEGLTCEDNLCVPFVCTDDASCGEGFVCEEGACVDAPPLDRPAGCDRVYGVSEDDIFGDDVIRLGMLMPTTGDLGAVGLAIEQAAALAIGEINGAASGVDGKPLGIIACDTGTDLNRAKAAANWLIREAGVPAIIGPATSSNTIGVFNDVARGTGTLLISPSATSPAITDLEDDDLLWRTVVSDDIQGRAIFAYLEEQAYTKVAMIHLNDAYGLGLRNAVVDPLCNIDLCSAENFLALPYEADEEGTVTADTVNQIISALRGFDPQVIIVVGFVEAGGSILASAGNAGFEDTPFILTDGLREDDLFDGVGNDTLLANVLGTAAASDDANYNVFAAAYRGEYGVEPGVYNAQAYDAAYLLALALAGSQGEYTGAALAAQLKRMSSGETVNARIGDFNKGARALRSSADATIDFHGASGALDFDPDTGDALADIEGWYFDIDMRTIGSYGVIYTSEGTYRDPVMSMPPEEME